MSSKIESVAPVRVHFAVGKRLAMGLMQFVVPDARRLASDAAERAHMTGVDGVPWLGRVVRTEGGLIADRPSGDSGNFHVPWRLEKHGELTLSTTSLMERARAYHLPVELARGTLHRLRTQVAVWEAAGMLLPDAVTVGLRTALQLVRQAVTSQANPRQAAQEADAAVATSLDVIETLTAAFAEQVLTARRRASGKLPTLLGGPLPDGPLDEATGEVIRSTFNTAVVPLRWSAIEPVDGRFDFAACDRHIFWCQSHGMRVCGGPLVQFDEASLPAWLAKHVEDFDRLLAYVSRFVQQTVTRYQGRVHLWLASARTNTGTALPLRDEQKLKLTLRAAETVRRTAPQVPTVVSLDLPWAEHMFARECDVSPLHFADALLRADLGLAGLGLEINLGYYPHGTLPRDPLAFSFLVDRWSVFNLPLLLQLTAPSGWSADPLARVETRVLPGMGTGTANDGPTPRCQRLWIERLLPLLLAKHAVQGIFWNQLADASPHDFPHGGLLDAASQSKPVVDTLRWFRQQHLM